jgi:hypothetical protein
MATRRCERCEKNRHERFYAPKGRVCVTCQKQTRRKSSRNSHIARTYGLTPEQHTLLLDYQGGVCAGCGESRKYNLCVDHDHALERAGHPPLACVRGLLCKRCNKVLAVVGDNPKTLTGLAEYIAMPPAKVLFG